MKKNATLTQSLAETANRKNKEKKSTQPLPPFLKDEQGDPPPFPDLAPVRSLRRLGQVHHPPVLHRFTNDHRGAKLLPKESLLGPGLATGHIDMATTQSGIFFLPTSTFIIKKSALLRNAKNFILDQGKLHCIKSVC